MDSMGDSSNLGMIIGCVVGFIVFIGLIVLVMYNTLIAKRNNVENAFSGIDVQLKKRCDLVPNLVAAVKSYMNHEKSVLEQISAYRSQAMKPDLSTSERLDLDAKISDSIRSIMVQVENYPDLKASENMMNLQRNITEVEEQISAARRSYNAAVTELNNSVQMFPSSLIASIFGFSKQTWFKVPETDRSNPDVSNLFKS